MDSPPFPLDWVRSQFPALSRTEQGRLVAYFDGPAGSQTPQSVAEAVARYLLETNSNRGGVFSVARESDALVDGAHQAAADFLGIDDHDCCVFGANMTTLTFAVSRALARTWKPGDEILVTRLDHDGNVSPWVLAARDAGATVRHVGVNLENGTLDQDDFRRQLSPRTKLLAVGYASNVTGTINPVGQMVAAAKSVGALTYVDAVHYAPHGLIDVMALDCDFLVCSAYKYFGPHVGLLYGRRAFLEDLSPYKLRVASNELPGKWMTGTAPHESLAGVTAAIDYLAELGRRCSGEKTTTARRAALGAAFAAVTQFEQTLSRQMLDGLREMPAYRLWGLRDVNQVHGRVPTFSLTHATRTPRELATHLSERGLFTWCGNHYGLPFTEAAGLEPHGTLRIGLLHYNAPEEVARLLTALRALA